MKALSNELVTQRSGVTGVSTQVAWEPEAQFVSWSARRDDRDVEILVENPGVDPTPARAGIAKYGKAVYSAEVR